MTSFENFLNVLAPFTVLLQMLFTRVLFTALALCALTAAISHSRLRLSPARRAWLWASCIPALVLPIEASAVSLAQRLNALSVVQSFIAAGALAYLPLALSGIWLAGVIVYIVKTAARRYATLRLLKMGEINSCAAYFVSFRSRVYLPPNFETDYSPEERKMLLAHERQHVKQHDPLLFSALEWLICVFWFCPAIRSAVRLSRRDRELLCDERVTRRFSRHEYGALLLREAGKSVSKGAIAGINADSAGMYERIKACAAPPATPKSKQKIAAVAVIAACVFAAGLIGVIFPVIETPTSVRVLHGSNNEIMYLDGAERFVSLTGDGAQVDEDGLYDFVKAAGLADDTMLHITTSLSVRPMLFSQYSISVGAGHRVGELRETDIFVPGWSELRPWDWLYCALLGVKI